MSRIRYFVFRIIQTVFLLWLIITFLFVFFRMIPGNYANIMTYQGASEAAIEASIERWGLNEPLYVQYWDFIKNFALGDMGRSIAYNVPAWEYVSIRIFNSAILVAPAITVGYLIGSLIGGFAGSKQGSRFDNWAIVPFIIVGSVPIFFSAILGIVVFAGWLNWVPSSGMYNVGQLDPSAAWWEVYLSWNFAHHYVLPFSIIVLRYIYLPSLIMRSTVVELLDQDFVYYHQMTGIRSGSRVFNLIKHSSLPLITLFPISITRALGGLVLLEYVFNWPGIGFALVNAVFSRDYPVLQLVFFIIAVFVVIANFAVDISLGLIDPRISVEE